MLLLPVLPPNKSIEHEYLVSMKNGSPGYIWNTNYQSKAKHETKNISDQLNKNITVASIFKELKNYE